jgi:hypothetical protein
MGENAAHKKGRCKRSGQNKTLDPGATNQRRCTRGDESKSINSSEICRESRGQVTRFASRFPVVLRESEARISLWWERKNSDSRHAVLQPVQQF